MKSVIFGYKHQFELDLSCETNPSDARQREEKKPKCGFLRKRGGFLLPKGTIPDPFQTFLCIHYTGHPSRWLAMGAPDATGRAATAQNIHATPRALCCAMGRTTV